MKKLLIITLIIMVAIPAFARIKDQNVTDLITVQLKQAREVVIGARNRLINCRDKMQAINSSYSSEVDSADLTLLTSIFSDINDAIDTLDDVGINIDTNFPTIQE